MSRIEFGEARLRVCIEFGGGDGGAVVCIEFGGGDGGAVVCVEGGGGEGGAYDESGDTTGLGVKDSIGDRGQAVCTRKNSWTTSLLATVTLKAGLQASVA